MPFVQSQKGLFDGAPRGPKRLPYEETFFTDAKVSAEAPGSAVILS